MPRLSALLTCTALLAALPARAAAPAEVVPKLDHFEIHDVDTKVDPCTDFYQYACGSWLDRNPIPADRGSYGKGNRLIDVNQRTLREVLESASKNDPQLSAPLRQIGDAYAACMDEARIEQRGVAALKPELDRIAALKSKRELPGALAHLHGITANLLPPTDSGSFTALFGFTSSPDYDDVRQMVAVVDQGGLGLPNRDAYLNDDAPSKQLRTQYLAHVQKMFTLLGEPAARASADAKTVLDVETSLAKASMDIVARRDPKNLNHKLSLDQLAALTPAFDWKAYLKATGAPATDHYLVNSPAFLTGLQTELAKRDLAQWKTYLRWNLVHASAGLLPAAFVQADFDLFAHDLSGAKELRPRWKRCVAAVDRDLGEALGQAFVEKTLGDDGRRRMGELVQAVEGALNEDIQSLDWMGPATKKEAQTKLAGVLTKVGGPVHPRDYSSVTIRRTDALNNAFAAGRFEFARQLARIGKPTDRTEWVMTAPTVDAYYDPQTNTINFMAGILQPPFFDRAQDDAVNLGAIGSLIGHELTHGFDDQGRQFDAAGALRDWWTPEDSAKFEQRTQCLVDQYSGYTAVGDLKLNGKLTLGENTADAGGLRVAYQALLHRLAQNPSLAQVAPGQPTPQQRFFLAYAQIWCRNMSEASTRLMIQTDPHPPFNLRVNGALSNFPEFQRAYQCKAGAPMVRAPACRVW